MPERSSSGDAGGAAAFQAAGGVAAGGALLSTIVVMLMTLPRSKREWAVGVISNVVTGVTGVGGGEMVVQYFGLQEWVNALTGLVTLGGLIFGCGLPGLAIVRWVFNFIEKHRDAGIDEVAKEVKEVL